MPLQYTNSKKQRYYLHLGKTKKGNPRYYFSMKETGELVDSIPFGYDIYENPNAQVFLRKIQPKEIFDDEKAIVEAGIKKYTDLKYYKIDIKKKSITLFIADQDVDYLIETMKDFNPHNFCEEIILGSVHYLPIMQFILVDKEKRLFITKRYCFLGSIDDWIEIGQVSSLEKLTKRYLKHLGCDSYFELF